MYNEKSKINKNIFYVRTDMDAADLKAGGSVAHTLGVIEGFLSLGNTVFCASSAMIALVKHIARDGFCVLKQPRLFSRISFRLSCFTSNFFFIPRCLFFLRNKKIDMVYQRYGLLTFVGVFVSWFKRVPLVLEFNGSEAWIDKHWVPQGRFLRMGFLIQWIENINLRRAHRIIVVSQALKDFLVETGVDAQKILVNPNGVNTNLFDPVLLVDERAQVRQELDLENKFVFGFVGSFSIWHGIETIAAMIPAVYRQCPSAHFLLIGDGPLLPYLKGELKKAGIGHKVVTLTGSVVQADAKKYLAACDAFLSPTKPNKDGSRFFGSPTKMFEYMSLGKPIIASDLEQLADLLFPAFHLDCMTNDTANGDEIGFLVQPEDVQGFINVAVALVAMDAKVQMNIGKNARQKAIEHYSWQDHTQRILSFSDQ